MVASSVIWVLQQITVNMIIVNVMWNIYNQKVIWEAVQFTQNDQNASPSLFFLFSRESAGAEGLFSWICQFNLPDSLILHLNDVCVS